MKKQTEKEITAPVKLCDENGRLNPDAVGWSRKPLHTCNLKGHWLRKKKWNYWCITNDKYAFSVTVANVDYLAIVAAYFIDFETKEITEWNAVSLFGVGCKMLDEVEADYSFNHPFMNVVYKQRDEILFKGTYLSEVPHRRIQITTASMQENKLLGADLWMSELVEHESLNVVVPWGRNKFQFTCKLNILPTSGMVSFGEKIYTFEKNSFACLDFGRGIWPYRTKWNWASCSARYGYDTIGLNLGGMWTDGTGSTENGICVNGKLYKISEDVKFQYNRKNFIEPWKIFTPDSDAVNLTFTPFFEKKNKLNLLVLSTEVHQMFGKFSGTVKTADGDVNFHGFIGWSEESINCW